MNLNNFLNNSYRNITNKLNYTIPPLIETSGNSSNSLQLIEISRITQIIESIVNTKTFKIALTHKSFLKSNLTMKSYETLEFLGDSLLQLYVSLFLYLTYPNFTEGRLVEERTLLVNNNNLALLSLKIQLYKYLKTDKKVTFTDSLITKVDHKILSDIFESFLAALYIEKGCKLLWEFICLTVLDRPEYKDKLPKFENELPRMYNFNIILWRNNLENSIKPIGEKDNIEYEFKSKLIKLMDKSLSTHNKINEFIINDNLIISELIKALLNSELKNK